MTTFVLYDQTLSIPAWVDDLPSFRRWVRSDDFPETGRICFLNGEVWVDMRKEQFFTHNQIKGEFNGVLWPLAKGSRRGRYVPDGMLLTNVEANLSSQPDGAYFSFEAQKSGRIRLVEGAEEGFLELDGSPEMALEIVSPSSVEKDTVTLRELYWQAGINEYWLVDARGESVKFDILRRGPRGYVAARKQNGWMKSQVFGKSFRLTRQADSLGNPDCTLEVR